MSAPSTLTLSQNDAIGLPSSQVDSGWFPLSAPLCGRREGPDGPAPTQWRQRSDLPLSQRERGALRLALAVHIRLHRLSVFGAGEGLAIGHPHHIGENLQ